MWSFFTQFGRSEPFGWISGAHFPGHRFCWRTFECGGCGCLDFNEGQFRLRVCIHWKSEWGGYLHQSHLDLRPLVEVCSTLLWFELSPGFRGLHHYVDVSDRLSGHGWHQHMGGEQVFGFGGRLCSDAAFLHRIFLWTQIELIYP